ncbi:hypothetical protein [Methanosarcina mazei]|uniref:Uncharacterized protein n=1 Tax=Methanosarcina mazei SarPi TaxID=1434115 RepID=A0A0E3RCR2_METMZ|nr:hypothetical protein [Methanosarcina mazei]AKB61668.1 hypothetical protein MSMAP_1683 [Methanosarcina mazei SarPi]UWJ23373.1 hypothetical protein MSMAT_2116 [Methanosarcina mazei TMA]
MTFFPENERKVSGRKITYTQKLIPEIFQKYFRDFSGYFKLFQKYFRIFQDISGYFRDISEIFQRYFRDISEVILLSFRIIITLKPERSYSEYLELFFKILV